MGTPQWIFLVLGILCWIAEVYRHDMPRKNYSAVSSTINLVLTFGLLYWGGFFG